MEKEKNVYCCCLFFFLFSQFVSFVSSYVNPFFWWFASFLRLFSYFEEHSPVLAKSSSSNNSLTKELLRKFLGSPSQNAHHENLLNFVASSW